MTEGSAHPPKARLVLRVGITGHRPNKLGSDLETVRATVRATLAALMDNLAAVHAEACKLGCYNSEPPLLRIISSLAEGADRLAADEAVAPCSELQVILPFASEEYQRDFTADASKKEFRDLVARATAVMTLDGTRAAADRAYRAAGLTMLRQSDVVIAVWDGAPPVSSAGTGAIAEDALATGIPVLWIEPAKPRLGARLITRIDDTTVNTPPTAEDLTAEALKALLTRLLIPPEEATRHANGLGKARRQWRAYLRETWPRRAWLAWAYGIWASLWAWTRLGFGGLLPSRAERESVPWPSPPPDPSVDAGFEALLAARAKNRRVYDRIKAHYLWADQIANYCARQYRGAYVLAFCLAPWAIAAAVLHLSVVKLIIVAIIVGVVAVAAERRWHARWLACRGLAEQLRQLRILAPLGRVPAHDTGPDPGRSWADWHFRAVAREVGVVNADLDQDLLRKALAEHVVQGLLEDQIKYHESTEKRSHHTAHRLHVLHYILFGATVGAVVAQVFHPFCIFGIDGSGWAIIFSAFGGASIGLANQGEFARVAQTSKAMKAHLEGILSNLQRLPAPPSATELGDQAERAAALMLKDVLGWRALFLTRPLEPPA